MREKMSYLKAREAKTAKTQDPGIHIQTKVREEMSENGTSCVIFNRPSVLSTSH